MHSRYNTPMSIFLPQRGACSHSLIRSNLLLRETPNVHQEGGGLILSTMKESENLTHALATGNKSRQQHFQRNIKEKENRPSLKQLKGQVQFMLAGFPISKGGSVPHPSWNMQAIITKVSTL